MQKLIIAAVAEQKAKGFMSFKTLAKIYKYNANHAMWATCAHPAVVVMYKEIATHMGW